jgi:hypothetical protein
MNAPSVENRALIIAQFGMGEKEYFQLSVFLIHWEIPRLQPRMLPTRETDAVYGNLHSRSVPQKAAWQRAQHQRCCIPKPRVERRFMPLNPGNIMRFQTTLKELRPAATPAGLVAQPFPTQGWRKKRVQPWALVRNAFGVGIQL